LYRTQSSTHIPSMAPKRSGAAKAGRPAKKARTEVVHREKDPVKENVKLLVAAFEDDGQVGLSTIPEMTKEMLQSVITTSLGVGAAADERHSYQVQLADAIGEVLKDVVKITESKVAEAQKGVVDAEALRTEKAGMADAAESTLTARTSDSDTAQENLTSAKQAVVDAKISLEKAKDEVDSFDVQLIKKTEQLEKVKAVLADNFGVLKAGVDWPSEKEQKAGEKKHLGSISSMLKQLKADSSLMSALECALTKKPEQRGQFDTMAIDQLESVLTSKVTEHETHINNAESIKAEITAAVAAAETHLANSEAAKTNADEALAAAKMAQKEAQTALKDAKKAVANQDTAVDEAKDHSSETESSLEQANKNVEAFTFLYSRPSKAPEPEPIEVDEVAEPVGADEDPAPAPEAAPQEPAE